MRQLSFAFWVVYQLLGSIASEATASPTVSPNKVSKSLTSGQRSTYMNGIDISSARNQDLRNVHVKIDEYGNLFITAPHYQVTEEESFTPLSSYKRALPTPELNRPQTPEQAAAATPPSTEASAIAAPVKVGAPSEAPTNVVPVSPAASSAPR